LGEVKHVKKVLIGVGIGCGVLVLFGVIAVVAGGFWVKSKAQELAQGGEKAQGMEKRVVAANQRYAFTPPQQGQPIQLTESRLQDYLKVREAMLPVFKDFDAKAQKLNGKEDGLNKSLQAFGLLSDLRADLTAKWLEELERQKMSPREFHAITAAVYTSGLGKMKAELPKQTRTMYEQLKQQLQKQAGDESLPEEARTAAREQLGAIDQQLAELPKEEAMPPELQKRYSENFALVDKYKDQIAPATPAGHEIFLLGTDNEMSKAFQKALGEDANEQDEAK
jgi:hypothetical protein